jgi:hypothetical protein
VKFDREKQTERATPNRYEKVKAHGCCKNANRGHVRIVGRIARGRDVVGFLYENTCCGRKSSSLGSSL